MPVAIPPVVIKSLEVPLTPKPAPAAKPEETAPAEEEETWAFKGLVFDLMTGDPVFAAKIALVDAKGKVVGETETGTRGRYDLTVPAGPKEGYTLKISNPDYLPRCIDQGAATSQLREASEEDRMVLLHATNTRPWIGNTKSPTVHDLALIPVNAESR